MLPESVDALGNGIGVYLAVVVGFVVDIRVGIVTWLVAAAHEVPQELGDFGVLVHSGWKRRSALAWNLASALTFLVGAVAAYALAERVEGSYLLPFAAGSFLYIAAADLLLLDVDGSGGPGCSLRRAFIGPPTGSQGRFTSVAYVARVHPAT